MEKMSLKTFWETVEQRLAEASPEELRAILRAMANEIAPNERQGFVGKLKPPRSEETASPIAGDALLDEIDDFVEELESAMQNAEDWQEERGWNEYDDEDALGPYADFVETLTGLFEQAQAVFESGDFELARDAYGKLFQAQRMEDEFGRGVRADELGIEIAEHSAHYLRAVYETTAEAERPRVLFGELRQVRVWLASLRPTLNDLIQISVTPLPGYETFLDVWIAFLRTQSGADADAWLRQAIQLAQGAAGLEQLARMEGVQHPRAYLDWFTARLHPVCLFVSALYRAACATKRVAL